MPGRQFSATDGYRYGFNGKENDNEVKGEGNQQDYGLRICDARLGKFFSYDPLAVSYPWYTPYQLQVICLFGLLIWMGGDWTGSIPVTHLPVNKTKIKIKAGSNLTCSHKKETRLYWGFWCTRH